MKAYYDIQDVINAGYTLEPLKCRYCGSLEVEYNQGLYNAYCAECGKWQLNPEGGNHETIYN